MSGNLCRAACAAVLLFGVGVYASATATPLAVDEGFKLVDVPNAGIYANGWIRQNNSEQPLGWGAWGNGWHGATLRYYAAYDAPATSFILAMGDSEVPESGTVSVWLLSPPIAFSDAFSLSFQTRSFADPALPPGADRLQVRLCANGACTDLGSSAEDVGDFETVLLDINADEQDDGFPLEWTEYTLGSGGVVPTSGVGRVAFRYYVRQTPGHTAAGRLGLDRVVIGAERNPGAGLTLNLTASPYDPAVPDACGGTSRIEATVGDRVNLCYEVANASSELLRHHWLRDDRVGTILSADTRELPPAASYRYNRVITIGRSEAISATATSQTEAQDYRYDDSLPPAYIDAQDGEVVVPGEEIATMPFDFRFYRRRVAGYCITNDGVFAVAGTNGCPQAALDAIPTTNADYAYNSPFAALYAERFWSQQGRIYRKVIGAAPNRRLVIQWYQKVPVLIPPGQIDPSRGLDAELILSEGSDQIEFQYRNTRFGALATDDDGGNASIGLQKDLSGLRYSQQSPSLETVRRIVWTPTTPLVHVDTRAVEIVALAPELRSGVEAIAASAPSHGVAEFQLSIDNAGGGRLDWSMMSASASHNPFPLPALASNEAPFTAPNGSGRVFHSFDFYDYAEALLIRYDLAHTDYSWPDGAVAVANLNGRLVRAAAFVDDDFATMYAIDDDTRELLRWHDVGQPYPAAAYDVVGTIPLLIDQISGMRQDPTTGTTYLSTSTADGSRLWTLDLATAAVHSVGAVPNAPLVTDIAFDTDGQLYAVDEALNALLKIDKHTGEAAVVGPLGFDPVDGGSAALDFDAASGSLYLISVIYEEPNYLQAVWKVDPNTGAATFSSYVVGIDNGPVFWSTLAIARPMSPCAAPEDVPWLSVTPAAGMIDAGDPPQTATVRLDGMTLPDGTYTANLCLYSNDPLRRRQTLPVRFEVGADAIFVDGFEPRP